MLAIAGGLLLIIFTTGNPAPKDRPEAPRTAPTPVDTQRVTGFQHQLAQRERDLAREMASLEQAKPSPEPPPGNSPQATSQRPTDPLQDERRRREYQSLFASNVALTTRTDQNSLASSAAPVSGTTAPAGDRELQALEAQGRESLARLNASVTALERAATAPPAAPAGAASNAASTPARRSTGEDGPRPPASTPAIRPGAPLHRLLEGTIIEAVLMTRLDGDFAGPVLALVTTPVFSHHGDALIIPAGSKVIGRAKAVDTWGQRRLAVSFHRLLLPDGSTYALDNFTGLNAVGETGLKDQVNNHYLATFGTAAAVGLVSGLAQYLSAGALAGGDGNGDRTVVIAGSGADSTAQAVAQVLSRYTNRLPTITIREGHRLKVYLTQDLELPVYQDIRRTLVPNSARGGF